MAKKKGLGKGLDALLPDWKPIESAVEGFFMVDPREIHPNPYQPRKHIDKDALEELAGSIKEKGVIQPLILCRNEDGYELIAGERRLRAALMAGLDAVPVIVKDVAPAEMLEMALIENIQREELNALEEAEAYSRLIEEFGLTQEALADRVGKKRATITNCLRLRKLPDRIKEDLLNDRISMGHARAIVALENIAHMIALRDEIVKKDLSVRAAERFAAKLKAQKPAAVQKKSTPDPLMEELAQSLSRSLRARVRITKQGQKGSIRIEFFSDEELDRLLSALQG
jgi:ParB family transcriptional regulator, chromosome partitioning protein